MSSFESPSTASGGLNEELAAIAAQIDVLVAKIQAVGDTSFVDSATFQSLLTPLVKLYGTISEDSGRERRPTDRSVTPTDIVVLACALLRVQDLNPFDLAVWFSRIPKFDVPTP